MIGFAELKVFSAIRPIEDMMQNDGIASILEK